MSRCDWCGRAGVPYVYRGIEFDGLIALRGERVCSRCAQAEANSSGVDIHVRDDGGRDYVLNTVRDKDLIQLKLPE